MTRVHAIARRQVHRLNALLLAGACIVSELSVDPVLDAAYSSGVVFAELSELEGVLVELLADKRSVHLPSHDLCTCASGHVVTEDGLPF
jgi:hypothetical protein